MSLHIGVTILGNLVTTAIVSRVGARRLIYVGFVLLSGGIGAAALAPSLPLLFASQFCIGLAQGISYPALMGTSIRYVADVERTTAMGLHQSVYAIGMFAGPWFGGRLADAMGIRSMFGVTALVCLALALLFTPRITEERAD
jgi:MFS family permease